MKNHLLAAVAAILCLVFPTLEARAGGLFEAEVVGIDIDGQVVAGIPGGAPWVVAEGEAEIDADGDLEVEVEGLLLLDGTVGPVLGVSASVHCASGATDEEAFTEVVRTASFPLSAAGDAKIEETFALPAQCSAAIVLVRVQVIDAGFVGGPPGVPLDLDDLGVTPPWIAASGF